MSTQTTKIDVKLTQEQHDIIVARAEELGFNKSEFIRFVALNAKINVVIGKTMATEIAEIQVVTRLFKQGMIKEAERDQIVERLIKKIGD